MRKLKTVGLIVACLTLATVFLAGCSSAPEEPSGRVAEEPTVEISTPEPTEEPTPEPTPEPTEEFLYKELGVKSPDAGSFLLTNNTDFMFTGLALAESDEDEVPQYGANLVPADSPVQQGETVCVYYPKDDDPQDELPDEPDDPDDAEDLVDGRDVEFNDGFYNIRLTTDSGQEFVLHDLDLSDIDTAYLSYSADDDLLYVEYQSVAEGNTVNTLEFERFVKDAQSVATPSASAATKSQSSAAPASGGGSSSSNKGSSSGGSSSSGQGGSSGGSSGGSNVSIPSSAPAPVEPDSSGSSGSSGGDSSGSSGSSGGSTGADSSGGSGSSGGSEWNGDDSQMGGCLEDDIDWNEW